jgi:hypothetical protein
VGPREDAKGERVERKSAAHAAVTYTPKVCALGIILPKDEVKNGQKSYV